MRVVLFRTPVDIKFEETRTLRNETSSCLGRKVQNLKIDHVMGQISAKPLPRTLGRKPGTSEPSGGSANWTHVAGTTVAARLQVSHVILHKDKQAAYFTKHSGKFSGNSGGQHERKEIAANTCHNTDIRDVLAFT